MQAFNNDNVELIDTDGQGVKELSAEGIIHDGKEYKVDCIIFASGFEVEQIIPEGVDIRLVVLMGSHSVKNGRTD